jgi:hypothetical protein
MGDSSKCSYCNKNEGVVYCMQHSLDYCDCNKLVCKECLIYSKCKECGSTYCVDHSLSKLWYIKSKFSPGLFKYLYSFDEMRCYGCSCYNNLVEEH